MKNSHVPPATVVNANSPATVTASTAASPTADAVSATGSTPPIIEQFKNPDELIAHAKQLFGSVETEAFKDAQFPVAFQKLVEQLKIESPCESLTASCNPTSMLCAIVTPFNNWTVLQSLLEVNPWLNNTVWTTWCGVAFIWLKVEGWRPQNRNMHAASWLWVSGGVLPLVEVAGAGSYPEGFPIRKKGTAIITIQFEQIIWPPEIHELFLLVRSIARHGALFLAGPRNRVILGVETAAHFLGALLGLKYCRRDDAFTMCVTAGQPEPISKSRLSDEINKWLLRQVERAGATFPSGEPVADVMRSLKQMYASEQLDEADGLRAFMRECVGKKAGCSVTMREMFQSYICFCQARDAIPYPERIFYTRATAIIRESLYLCKSHKVQRPDSSGRICSKYGFKNLCVMSTNREAEEAGETEEHGERSEHSGGHQGVPASA